MYCKKFVRVCTNFLKSKASVILLWFYFSTNLIWATNDFLHVCKFEMLKGYLATDTNKQCYKGFGCHAKQRIINHNL